MKGRNVSDFSKTIAAPVICPSGVEDGDWVSLLQASPDLWKDQQLIAAGKEFSLLVIAQKAAFAREKVKPDIPDKALNIALTAGWAYVAGALHNNPVRLHNHFDLRSKRKPDPLSADKLAQGRFKFDPPNYRGLGNRTDAKEAGRSAEVFWLQAEKGAGINLALIKKGITRYEMKILQNESADE